MLAVGTRHRVRLVDAATGIVKWEEHSDRGANTDISRVIMSPNGRFLASVSIFEEFWKLFDSASGVVCMTGARHDGTGACACTVTLDGSRESLDEGCPVRAHTGTLNAVAYSPCGHRLATGGEDCAVILWDAGTGKAEQVLQGHTQRVTSVSFSANGARLASGSYDSSIRVWDTVTGGLLRTIPLAHDDRVFPTFRVHFSPTDSRILASTGGDGLTARQWDVESGKLINSVKGCRFAVFSPDGRSIATASANNFGDVELVDAASGALLLSMVGHLGHVYSSSFSPNGAKLASASYDGTCRVWDLSTGALLRTIELGSVIYSVAWGRDWVLDTQKAVAFAMGHHPRLGAASRLQVFDTELVRMILDYA